MGVQDVGVSKKLLLAFGIAFATVATMCTSVFLVQQKSMAAAAVNAASYVVVDDVDQALGSLHDQNASIRGLSLYKLPRYADKYRAAGELIDGILVDAHKASAGDPTIATELDSIAASIHLWQDEIGNRALALGSDAATVDQAVALTASERASVLFNKCRAAIAQARKKINAWSDRNQVEQDGADALLRTILLAGALISLAVMLAAWLWLTRAIARPVAQMSGSMKRLAAGDNTVEVPAAGRRDEIGQMADAVQAFKKAAIEKIRLEQDAAEARRLNEEERARSEALQAETARQQSRVVAALASGLERLSSGDLEFRLEEQFAKEYEKLRADFNEAMGQLQQTMRVVVTNAGAIRLASGEISTAADDLSRRTEQQAASLEQTAAALGEITGTVAKTASGAGQARQAVATAKVDAEDSGTVVRQAIEAMSSIETSSRQIAQIIGVIDEIAFQTSLLALNAGVEAARAGDAGRGFAVVASEVRGLAQRSAEAAKEIKALIATSATHVKKGVSIVRETGSALDRIVKRVGDINVVVTEIAASAEAQSTALQEVNTAVNQMDQVTQRNAAMVEQTTAASQGLAKEAEGLARLVARFKTGQADALDRGSPHPIVRKASQMTVPALKVVGNRGRSAALKTQDAPASDSWEEF